MKKRTKGVAEKKEDYEKEQEMVNLRIKTFTLASCNCYTVLSKHPLSVVYSNSMHILRR